MNAIITLLQTEALDVNAFRKRMIEDDVERSQRRRTDETSKMGSTGPTGPSVPTGPMVLMRATEQLVQNYQLLLVEETENQRPV